MQKRHFLKIAAFSGLAGFVNPFQVLQARPTADTFKLPSLPYAFDALEPYIDKVTMQVHHDKHHQSYTDKLNAAISGTKYEKMSIEDILKNVGKDETAIRNNGGGYYNHNLFWKWLSPQNSAGQPSGKLSDAMNSAFGSMDSFKEKFSAKAGDVFGSGWAWLLADKNGKLSIASTPNQDSPLMSFAESKGMPILGIDVWEHAYYLKYQNLRADYVKAFWNVVNWKEVDNLYSKAAK